MSTKTQSAIAVSGLRKSYDHVVLDGVSLDIPAGSVFALLGPNGAGKTTTVNILTTLIPADAGEIVVAGHDLFREPHAVRAAIGVTGQFSAVDNLLTGEENLLLMADLHHLAPQNRRNRTRDLLEQFGLTDVARKLAATYSGGMRRRLDLAMGLIGDPQVLFLDEPTTGLDPRSRRAVWQIIRELVSGGVTVFLTTQYLEEADHLASQIAVLDRGQIVADGTPAQLKARIPGSHIRVVLADTTQLSAAAHTLAATTVDDVEFQRLYLAFDQAMEWSPDDARLEQLADDITSYLGTDQHRELDTQPPPEIPAGAIALIASTTSPQAEESPALA
jgi:ABC-2 type transport system ATP-binding protein